MDRTEDYFCNLGSEEEVETKSEEGNDSWRGWQHQKVVKSVRYKNWMPIIVRLIGEFIRENIRLASNRNK